MAQPRIKVKRWGAGAVAAVAALSLTLTGCGGSSTPPAGDQPVTITFSQWWEPETPAGSFRALMDEFEKQNPNIKVELLSQPYASVQTQMTSGAAAGNLPDVVGLDGAWVNALHKQGALVNLSEQMAAAKFDPKNLRDKVEYDGSTFMIPFVNFAYPLFTNDEILAKAGISAPPKNWTEFQAAAKAISALDGVKGFVVPLGTTNPNGAQNDIMSWAWASGGSMLQDGQPHLTDNAIVHDSVDMIKKLVQDDLVLPGAATMQESDKVNNFINGRVGMMINGLSITSSIKEGAPNLKYTVSGQPTKDDFTGTPGMLYAAWGIGISKDSKHPAESWKLIQYLLGADVNAKIAGLANGFPGVGDAKPVFTDQTDPHVKQAYAVYEKSKPVNEFVGLPSASQLQTDFVVQFQKAVKGDQTTDEMLKVTQDKWLALFK